MGKLFNLKPYFDSSEKLKFKSHFNLTSDLVCIDFTLSSSTGLKNINIPKLNEVKRENELWKTTCFECFLFYPEGDYYELNVSPSGGWNSYSFSSYRKNMKVVDDMSITHLSSSLSEYEFHLETCFQHVDKRYPSSIQICAVISNGTSNNLNYWAIKHSSEKPDFHEQSVSTEYRWV